MAELDAFAFVLTILRRRPVRRTEPSFLWP